MLRDHLSVRPSICLVIAVFLGLHFCPLGADGVNQASKERGTDILASEGSIVHKNCQHRYTDKKVIAKRKSSVTEESSFITEESSITDESSITEESSFSRKSVRLSIESPS